ncbi:MAG: hypothetical protein HRT45_00300 [Bdellovibrionales bacterium]|nr:hypothetical protein [Bdellovibrionales bacterium]
MIRAFLALAFLATCLVAKPCPATPTDWINARTEALRCRAELTAKSITAPEDLDSNLTTKLASMAMFYEPKRPPVTNSNEPTPLHFQAILPFGHHEGAVLLNTNLHLLLTITQSGSVNIEHIPGLLEGPKVSRTYPLEATPLRFLQDARPVRKSDSLSLEEFVNFAAYDLQLEFAKSYKWYFESVAARSKIKSVLQLVANASARARSNTPVLILDFEDSEDFKNQKMYVAIFANRVEIIATRTGSEDTAPSYGRILRKTHYMFGLNQRGLSRDDEVTLAFIGQVVGNDFDFQFEAVYLSSRSQSLEFAPQWFQNLRLNSGI